METAALEMLREINGILIGQQTSFEEKTRRLLEVGCRRFRMELGIVSRIDGDRYEVMEVAGGDSDIRQGTVFALGVTACSITLSHSRPVQFEDLADTEYCAHPCYTETKLRAYIGAPVTEGDRVYGTINFSSLQPRSEPFTELDDELLRVMAGWVSEQLRTAQFRRRLSHVDRLSSLGTLAAGVAHELRNPLAGLKGCAERLRGATLSPEKKEEYWDAVMEALHRMEQITRGCTEFGKRRQRKLESLDVFSAVRSASLLLGSQFRNKSVILNNAVEPGVNVIADRSELAQILTNTLMNGLDAAPPGTEVKVSALTDGDTVVSITDHGPGIPDDRKEAVFRAFVTDKGDAGTGLGLAITRELVEQSAGKVWIEDARRRRWRHHNPYPTSGARLKLTVSSPMRASGGSTDLWGPAPETHRKPSGCGVGRSAPRL